MIWLARGVLKWLGIIAAAVALFGLASLVPGEDSATGRGIHLTLSVLAGTLSIAALLLRRLLPERRSGELSVVRPTHPKLAVASNSADDGASIEAVRRAVGEPPRRFDGSAREYVRVDPPPWPDPREQDALHDVAKDQDAIRRDGDVVWACVVQANHQLFRPGVYDLAASLAVGDRGFDADTQSLERIASVMFQAREGSADDSQLAEIGRALEAETDRGMGLPMPRTITGGRLARHISILFPRAHLPHGYLTGRVLPVWLDRRRPFALIVPAGYWPDPLLARWTP